MDDLDITHPCCPDDSVLLREVDAGRECPACKHFEPVASGPLPEPFDDPSSHGG